jgi:hypothetical protein
LFGANLFDKLRAEGWWPLSKGGKRVVTKPESPALFARARDRVRAIG